MAQPEAPAALGVPQRKAANFYAGEVVKVETRRKKPNVAGISIPDMDKWQPSIPDKWQPSLPIQNVCGVPSVPTTWTTSGSSTTPANYYNAQTVSK